MAAPSLPGFLSLPLLRLRWHSSWPYYHSPSFIHFQHFRVQSNWGLTATLRKKISETSGEEEKPSENGAVVKKESITAKQTRKKAKDSTPDGNSKSVVNAEVKYVQGLLPTLREDEKKISHKAQKKVASASTSQAEQKTEKKLRRQKTKKEEDDMLDQYSEFECSDAKEVPFIVNYVGDKGEDDLELEMPEGDDICYTYGWPPLVCCFGAAQHAFVPSGRPANRLINYELHDRMKDALWAPEKFIRAPGGSAGSVALALASLGGKVAFMGKLGDDEYGQAMLYYLNVNKVQTRSVCLDSKRATAISQMKIGKRGRLRMTCLKPCAEDSLLKSEINIDVLKEAKMFYFSTHSLLDRNMRSTTLQAVKISKKLGGVIFFDVNLPLPLWQSYEETKNFIEQAWNLADFVEVTTQELEFLCGINPLEEFDSKSMVSSKFVHYDLETVAPLWHEKLKILFVTNGTSKIHYYTKEHNGAVHGMEDAPISPFTCDMSASGDGVVAALMRMLTIQPDLITDRGYLEQTIKYAINCGVIDQWLLARTSGFPPKEDIEGREEEEDNDGEQDEVSPDPNGIRSITEREHRTLMESVRQAGLSNRQTGQVQAY